MNHLIYVGPSNTGKTTLVNRAVQEFLRLGFTQIPYNPVFGLEKSDQNSYGIALNEGADSYILLERNGKIILCYTWSDTEKLVLWLKNFIERLRSIEIIPDLIVTASRDASESLYQFTVNCFELSNDNRVEIPLGRMVRGPRRVQGVEWYLRSIERMVNELIIPRVVENL